MAKLLLNSAGKVLMDNDKVYKAPNYVDIPQVTNIQLSEQGVLSWNAPDITSLSSYSPTLSYIINVNGYELTSTTASINLISYLLTDSENVITVKVKAVLTHYSNNKQETFEAYSLPAEYVKTLVDIVPPETWGLISGAIVGHKAYVFGGNSYSNQSKYSIERVDFENRTCETITASFKDIWNTTGYGYRPGETNTAVAVGTNIYLFGGGKNATKLNTIFKFDTLTETLSTLETTLVEAMDSTLPILYGKYVYIFGGRGSSRVTNIFKFDTENETLTMLETTLPITQYYYNRLTGQAVGTNIYLFDKEERKIYKFNTENETIETISSSISLPSNYALSSALIGNNIYIFTKYIYKFDTLTETYTTTEHTLPKNDYSCAVVYNGKAYILGGNSMSGTKDIIEVCLAG